MHFSFGVEVRLRQVNVSLKIKTTFWAAWKSHFDLYSNSVFDQSYEFEFELWVASCESYDLPSHIYRTRIYIWTAFCNYLFCKFNCQIMMTTLLLLLLLSLLFLILLLPVIVSLSLSPSPSPSLSLSLFRYQYFIFG